MGDTEEIRLNTEVSVWVEFYVQLSFLQNCVYIYMCVCVCVARKRILCTQKYNTQGQITTTPLCEPPLFRFLIYTLISTPHFRLYLKRHSCINEAVKMFTNYVDFCYVLKPIMNFDNRFQLLVRIFLVNIMLL